MRTQKLVLGMSLVLGLLLLVGGLLVPAQAAPEYLPPRPEDTPTPTVPPGSTPERSREGAVIVLEVAFGADWPARESPWQELWTVVEWQDGRGTWHVVEGWRGGLNRVSGSRGWVTWWLARDLFGRGPFRWVVYEERGGPVMVVSEPFDLPGSADQVVTVEVSLSP